jgi:hypothetical protein
MRFPRGTMSGIRQCSAILGNTVWVGDSRVKLIQVITIALLLIGPSAASGQPVIGPAEMAIRCWATHVVQGERVKTGTRTALIAEENASFWRSEVAKQAKEDASLDASLAVALERTRTEYNALPAQGFMQIAFNAATCQTLRADIQPGYDPVQQNLGQR